MLTYCYEAVVQRVIDGDTVIVDVDLGFAIWTSMRCRLAGINAPELFTGDQKEAGQKAKEFLMQLLPVGSKVFLKSSKFEKYGRALVDLWVWGEDVICTWDKSVNMAMVNKGFAALSK